MDDIIERNPKKAAAHWEIARASLKYLWSNCITDVVPVGARLLFDLAVNNEESPWDKATYGERHDMFGKLLDNSNPCDPTTFRKDKAICVKPKDSK